MCRSSVQISFAHDFLWWYSALFHHYPAHVFCFRNTSFWFPFSDFTPVCLLWFSLYTGDDADESVFILWQGPNCLFVLAPLISVRYLGMGWRNKVREFLICSFEL
jgi:hypothetical protein